MLTMFRLIAFFLLPIAVAFGQENPLPSPVPVASPESMGAGSAPVAEGEVVPSPTPATDATPEAMPTPESATGITPDTSVSLAPEPTPPPTSAPTAPGDDIIPLPSDGGAPLDTQPIVPDSDNAFVDPNAIMPDMPPAMPAAVDNQAEKLRLETIRYSQVRTQVEKDPNVQSLKKQADQAKTDEDKRAAMREYYRLLFKKMVAIDKSLELKCKNMEDAYLRRLAQTRLEPTIPLNPPPTPEPIN